MWYLKQFTHKFLAIGVLIGSITCFNLYSEEITELYVWRHGETNSNHLGLLTGAGSNDTTTYLNTKGKKQVADLTQKVLNECPNIDVIYSSDLVRAVETAKFVQNTIGRGKALEIKLSPQLREIYHGKFEMTPGNERTEKAYQLRDKKMKESIRDPFFFWKIHPITERIACDDAAIRDIAKDVKNKIQEPETVYELYQRIITEMISIAEENKGLKIGISTHGGVLTTLIDANIHIDSSLYTDDIKFLPPYYMTKGYEVDGEFLMPPATKVDNCDLVLFRYFHDEGRLEYCGKVPRF